MPLKRRTTQDPTEAATYRTPVKKPKLPDFAESVNCSGYPYIPKGDLEKLAVPIEEIRPDPKNPRKNDKAARELSGLIRQYGFRKAVVIDQSGMLKAGHTAWKAAQILKMTHMPATRSDFDERESVGYLVSDNAIDGDWDNEMLVELMQAGKLESREMTGFDEKKWKSLDLSDELPPELVPVTLEGDSAETGDFLILRFPHTKMISRFKEVFGMGKLERAIDINELATACGKLKDFEYDSI